jgi:mono/diheme cytochrome c family protein
MPFPSRRLVALALGLFVPASSALLAAPEAPVPAQPFLEAHCMDCHDSSSHKGGLDLDALKFDPQDPRSFATWVKIYDRVHTGEMPPKKKAHVETAEREAFAVHLASALTRTEKSQIEQEGRAVWRRLNRYEYENTVRDLLHAPWLQLRDMLPEDGELQRFNKVGEALDVSHVQMQRYLAAADAALRQAMLPQAEQPVPLTQRLHTRQDPGLVKSFYIDGPVVRRGFPVLGTAADPHFPAPKNLKGVDRKAPVSVGDADPARREEEGVGVVVSTYEPTEIRFGNFAAPMTARYKLRFSTSSLWVGPQAGEKWWQPDFANVSASWRDEPVTIYSDIKPRLLRLLGSFDTHPEPSVHEMEAYLFAGETIRPDAARLFRARPPEFRNPLATPQGQPAVNFRWMEVEGPLFDQWPTASHRTLFGELPVRDLPDEKGVEVMPTGADQDASRLLLSFLQKAYRRPVMESDLPRFLGIYQKAKDAGQSFTESMLAAYTTVLCSPEFLYLQEKPGRLDSFALASRLSYFLWNSPPDEELRTLAVQGQLHEPAILRAQTERLLKDERSRRFVDAFLDYWLDLRKIAANDADATLYPDYQLDDFLMDSSVIETQLFFRELLREDLPVRNLVDANFALLNERLATHYAIPGVEVKGVGLRKVPLPPDSIRGGLMTQASILKITANGTTTSPVVRGVWVMERLLGERPPPPPSDVPAVEPDIRGATTIREQLSKHRDLEQCAGCHKIIDPAGFALENFDVMGGFRTRYRATGEGQPEPGVGRNGSSFTWHYGPEVDASGELPDGRKFRDVRELKALLAADEPKLARNLAKQFLIYGTGTAPRFADREQMDQLLERAKGQQYGVRAILHEVVQSPMFQTK